MGCLSSKITDTPNKEASNMKASNKKVRILVLGTGNSGKSTILKQMRVIYDNGFSTCERKEIISIICSNIITFTENVVALMKNTNSVPFLLNNSEVNIEDAFKKVEFYKKEKDFYRIFQIIRSMISNIDIIGYLQDNKDVIQNAETAYYFYKRLPIICSKEYIPSDNDMLHARMRTTGVIETTFYWKNHNICMIDVGGQRSERRKWIHVFDNINILLFCVSLNEYNVVADETNEQNMMESLLTFSSVIKTSWLQSKQVLLFLNKVDLFEKTIMRHPFSKYFQDYKGNDSDKDQCIAHIRAMFISQDFNGTDRLIFVHTTCATDSENMKTVFTVALDSIFQKNIENFGLE